MRTLAIASLTAGHLAFSLPRVVAAKRSFRAELAACLPAWLDALGGAFPKIGQILGTRVDLLPLDLCTALSRLQDDLKPISWAIVRKLIDTHAVNCALDDIDERPIACATIAQIHRGRRRDDDREVAIKIRRPGVGAKIAADCRLAQKLTGIIAHLPPLRGVPVRESLMDATGVLVQQANFRKEAHSYQRLRGMLSARADILVPAVHYDLCSDEIIVMDFVPGLKKLGDATLSAAAARTVLTAGLQALYQMIFEDGFIHCDMHPGNVLVAPDGRLVILDAGFMVEISPAARRAFAEFFLAIALQDASSAARIVRETAAHLPPNLDVAAFDRDIFALIRRMGGLRAADFQVASFVGELFAIQRKHGIYGTSQFTLIILALLVYEGVAKQRFPDLDFQREAIPFVMRGLAQPNISMPQMPSGSSRAVSPN